MLNEYLDGFKRSLFAYNIKDMSNEDIRIKLKRWEYKINNGIDSCEVMHVYKLNSDCNLKKYIPTFNEIIKYLKEE